MLLRILIVVIVIAVVAAGVGLFITRPQTLPASAPVTATKLLEPFATSAHRNGRLLARGLGAGVGVEITVSAALGLDAAAALWVGPPGEVAVGPQALATNTNSRSPRGARLRTALEAQGATERPAVSCRPGGSSRSRPPGWPARGRRTEA